jgi:multimeric flavodoxin WrbA
MAAAGRQADPLAGLTPEQLAAAHDVRKGQAPEKLSREEFRRRYMEQFTDPAFGQESEALRRIEVIAWEAFQEGRKSPLTRKAGPGYADPDYELSVDWLRARERIEAAARRQADAATPSRVLLIAGGSRNDGTCPGEASKTWRLAQAAREVLEGGGKVAGVPPVEVDFLDLSLITSEYGRRIHPCKGCVSTSMPLCHWPCSCYPNHSLGQTQDWMNEIYERFSAAHGVLFVTPTYWYQSPSPLKLMIDRLVCADGGNADPTSTGGKKPEKAKALELRGWDYPQHLCGRVYGTVVHGDVAGIEGTRRALSDWLDWMGLIDAGAQAVMDRYIGYYDLYATSHRALDADACVQAEARNVARAVAAGVAMLRKGELRQPDTGQAPPRKK